MTQLDLQFVQRWNEKATRWRPVGETIQTSKYEVAPLPRDEAKAFVERHHYSGTFPAARFQSGLWRGAQLVGAAVFSHPVNDAALRPLPGTPTESTELGRFVLLDSVPANGETWFLGQAFAALRREGLRGVVSFSDPLPRETAAGETIMPGHVGTIYQAHNGVYVGRGTARTLALLPDGRVFAERAVSKIRKLERGWRYAVAQLLSYGAERLELAVLEADEAVRRTWLARVLAQLTRPMRHAGNHKYVWAFDRHAQRAIDQRPARRLPKTVD